MYLPMSLFRLPPLSRTLSLLAGSTWIFHRVPVHSIPTCYSLSLHQPLVKRFFFFSLVLACFSVFCYRFCYRLRYFFPFFSLSFFLFFLFFHHSRSVSFWSYSLLYRDNREREREREIDREREREVGYTCHPGITEMF